MGDRFSRAALRRPTKALSARFVETVSQPGKYFDGHGLFLRVGKTGSRQWVQRITIRGKRCELGLGSPPAVSLAMARKRALDNRGKAMLGDDPLEEKRRQQAVLSFAVAVEEYLAVKLSEFRNEKHKKQWRATLDTYAVPVIGTKPVDRITVQDVLRVLHPIWHSKTETASRLRGRVEAVLSWATVAGYRTGDNPAAWKGNLSQLLPKPTKLAPRGNQPALALGDAPRWWANLHLREGIAARALEFLTLTAARSGEVRGMTWEEVAFGTSDAASEAAGRGHYPAAVWTIPAARMKNGRPHRVPLTDEAVTLLQGLPRLEGAKHVFFAASGGMLSDMSISSVMRRMQKSHIRAGHIGYLDPENKRPAVPHGLRSTFRQWAAEGGYPRDMAEIALAHFIGSEVERAYQRSDMLDRRRDMMSDWARFLQGKSIRRMVDATS